MNNGTIFKLYGVAKSGRVYVGSIETRVKTETCSRVLSTERNVVTFKTMREASDWTLRMNTQTYLETRCGR